MKANKKTLMAVKSMLKNEQEYWDKEEMISIIVEETKLIKNNEIGALATDECGIEWDGKEICNLSDFIDSFSNIYLEKICNMLDSFVGEDISCYLEDEEYDIQKLGEESEEIKMKFIIKDKLYDTEKAEKVIEYQRKFQDKVIGFFFYRKTILYKTGKGNWFSVSDADYGKYIINEETIVDAKEIVRRINAIDTYVKYFGALNEA